MQIYKKKSKKTNNIVKKLQIFYVFILLMALTPGLSAQRYVEAQHYLGLNVEAGGWGLLPAKDTGLKTAFGPGVELGFVYELQRRHLLFQTGIGAEFGMGTFRSDSAGSVAVGAKDMDGYHFDYTYEFGSRKDTYYDLAAELPLLLGGQWKHFYFLAGAKFKFHAYTRAHVAGNLSTCGIYQEIDPHHNMPEYEFVDDVETTTDVSSSLNLDVAASAEIGFRLGEIYEGSGFDVPKQRTQFRLALFADYGLLNIHQDGTNDPIVTPAKYSAGHMLEGIKYNDILSTSSARGRINSLFVGVKLTILFRVDHGRNWCLICREHHRSTQSSKSGKVATEL